MIRLADTRDTGHSVCMLSGLTTQLTQRICCMKGIKSMMCGECIVYKEKRMSSENRGERTRKKVALGFHPASNEPGIHWTESG